MTGRWSFWVDRGGTFTDVIAIAPDGRFSSHKLLSNNPDHYQDAAIEAIRRCLGIAESEHIPAHLIQHVKMGTTVATNALLEHKGEKTALVVTKGFADALKIGLQTRPDLFDTNIHLPTVLYKTVIEVTERVLADGQIQQPLILDSCREALQQCYQDGIRSVAIVLMHGYQYPAHEQKLAALAKDIGFDQISLSHQVSPLIKFINRGDTTVVDAYLSPVLQRYIDQVMDQLGQVPIYFMQSNGGLIHAHEFSGKNAILSGPAGGIVGMVKTALEEGFGKVIGFDMGGTSTDVSHFSGEYERTFDTQIAGVKVNTPMMNIHTVAAGGGSLLHYHQGRFQVGPDSAGAFPGPASYRNGGTLAVTDCHVMLGRIQPDFFPAIFGSEQNSRLSRSAVVEQFEFISQKNTELTLTTEEIAEGFLTIAVENMANAIRHISVQRGYDIQSYALNAFGGAGGQHACKVADVLGMSNILIHRNAALLSAYGIGLADQRAILEHTINTPLGQFSEILPTEFNELESQVRSQLQQPGVHDKDIQLVRKAQLFYQGSDTQLLVEWSSLAEMMSAFERSHQQLYGFISKDKTIVIGALHVEGVIEGRSNLPYVDNVVFEQTIQQVTVYDRGRYRLVPIYQWQQLVPGERIDGFCIIVDAHNTVIVEHDWQVVRSELGNLVLTRQAADSCAPDRQSTVLDPIRLEVLNNRYMAIAEQMGAVLEKTATSVNIKERLDFSCAVFDAEGELIANAPHIPVHLGSMSASVQSVQTCFANDIKPQDVFVVNSPYDGGTHLPDITVVKPIFYQDHVALYVAARGHHADVGGMTPGSMPPMSEHIDQEGVLIKPMRLVDQGCFLTEAITGLLQSATYPSRNIAQNIADLKAQIAACEKGQQAVLALIEEMSYPVVSAYMGYVQEYAEDSVRRLLATLPNGTFEQLLDDGAKICVALEYHPSSQTTTIDFTGTSGTHMGNFNAPESVCRAAILYVFRCLIGEDIPLNAGFFKPLSINVPADSLMSPSYPAAVVSGNVETSQNIVDCLFGALGQLAGSQGTCNNLTFGNNQYQYYETLCGGTGAGATFPGASAVHSHMTNSRLTDPEILESRFPVLLQAFTIRHQSGGDGLHRGGDGVIRRIQFLEPMTVAIISSRRQVKPFGLKGGQPGQCGENWLINVKGQRRSLAGCDQVDVAPGECIEIRTPGGGGYGAN